MISLVLLALAWRLESIAGLPGIIDNAVARWTVFAASVIGAGGLAVWGFKSLPPGARGVELVTSGAFKYVRHPLYAAFLSSSNFGLAVCLNNWIYVMWAIALHGVWHWNVRSEEKLMANAFPQHYPDYCRTTGRFVPRIWVSRHKNESC